MSSFPTSILPSGLFFALAVLFGLPASNAQELPQKSNAKVGDIDVQYARKRVELAKVDLEVAIAQNRRIPQAYSQLSIMRLQNQVSQAEVLLEYVLQTENAVPHQAHIKCVQGSVELAKRQFDWVSEYSKKFPEMLPSEQVKRFFLNLELAQLALKRAQDPKVTSTPMDHLQWQMDQLQSEVLLLRLELERAKSGK